jgi:hypothetical protein
MMTRTEFEQMEKDMADFVKRYGRGPLKRGRGRPDTGISDALLLAIQVDEFCQEGMTRADAVRNVAELTHKSTAHVSLCHSMATENDLDRLVKKRELMVDRARKRKLNSYKRISWSEAMQREGRHFSR